MRRIDEVIFTMATEARQRSLSRRGFLTGAAKLAGAGAAAVAFAGAPAISSPRPAAAQGVVFNNDIDVLNYALTLERLETVLYREGLRWFGPLEFAAAGFDRAAYDNIVRAGEHEAIHAATLTQVISDLAGAPVGEAMYDFGFTDVTSFVQVATAVENVGVKAYTGAAPFIADPDLLTAALTIHGNEARHASYLNVLIGDEPYPEAFESPLTPDEVLAIAGPFIVSEMPATGTGSSL